MTWRNIAIALIEDWATRPSRRYRRLSWSQERVIKYPEDSWLLDEAAVESNLIWLARYPSVLKPFEAALKFYMAKDPNQYRSMLDNLRFALEQMVRTVLNNQKSLENQKNEFLGWHTSDVAVHVVLV